MRPNCAWSFRDLVSRVPAGLMPRLRSMRSLLQLAAQLVFQTGLLVQRPTQRLMRTLGVKLVEVCLRQRLLQQRRQLGLLRGRCRRLVLKMPGLIGLGWEEKGSTMTLEFQFASQAIRAAGEATFGGRH